MTSDHITSDHTTSDQLWQVCARLEIADGLARYCRAMDRMDDELAIGVWHPDGTATYEPNLFSGSAGDFVRFVRGVHEGFRATTHRMANTIIRVRGHHAVSEAYGHVLLTRSADDGTAVLRHAYGRYLDRWSFRDDRWAIDHRVYVRDIGYEHRTTVLDSTVRRDRSDPSYEILGDITSPWA